MRTFLFSGSFPDRRDRICEAEAVPIRIRDDHLARSPRHVRRGSAGHNPTSYELFVAGVDVRDDKVGCAADLAVTGVLGEKDRLARARQLREERESRLEAVLPVDGKAEAVDVEGKAASRVGNPKLGNDTLAHFSADR